MSSAWVLSAVVAVVFAGCGGSGPDEAGSSGTTSSASPGGVATCPAGSTPDAPGPAAQPRPSIYEGGWSAAMDTRSARVVVLDEQAATWTLDVCRNTWDQVRTTGSSPPAGAKLVYDPAGDLTYAFGDLEVRAYSSRTSAWTLVGDKTANLTGFVGWDWWVLDPGRHAVLFHQRSTGEIRGYDLTTHRWFAVEQHRPRPLPGLDALAVWDPTVGHVVLYIPYLPMGEASAPTSTPSMLFDAQTWTFDPATGTWARVAMSTPVTLFGYFPWGTEMAYDAASGKSVVLSTGPLATFDATASTWTVASHGAGWPAETPISEPSIVVTRPDGSEQGVPMAAGPVARTGQALVDDVVNGRVLVLGGQVRTDGPGWRHGTDTWAYRVGTTTWTEVVPQQP